MRRYVGAHAFSRTPHSTILSLSPACRRLKQPHRTLPTNLPSSIGCRTYHSNNAFEPLRPPSPSSLGQPRAARTYTRSRKWARRLAITALILTSAYYADRQIYASGMLRTARTFSTGLVAALDYKLNFSTNPLFPGTGGATIGDLHRRNAERLFGLLATNGGLYLKIGQAIAMQSAVLPPEFQRMFGRMFDDAPADSWADVEAVIRQDFGGRSVEDVFGVSFQAESSKGLMERRARASASVAQVHWARLPDGREVAIKIQKREIAKQISWDLWAFKTVTWIYSKWFDLPLYSLVPFITNRLELETDFVNEAHNSNKMRELVANEPTLRDRVYIPIVYPELTTRRVLTTEWIEGAKFRDVDAITSRWIGGYGKGSPGTPGSPLEAPNMTNARKQLQQRPLRERIKPERQEWRGQRGNYGLGLSKKEVMTTMVDLFSAQIFSFGVCHCDPHPGNIFIRRKPNGRAELVLIDHGLYVYLTPEFRHQYSMFWKALLTFDNKVITAVAAEWGIRAPEIFASATLLRPYEGGDGSTRKNMLEDLNDNGKISAEERQLAMQKRMKQGMRDVLADTERLPHELIFIGRNMRIVQGNNQYMGSPVNRVRLMGGWASRSLYTDPNLPLRERIDAAFRHSIFGVVMAASDLAFWWFQLRQWLGLGKGMEDELEERMRVVAKDFGVELQHEMFEG